VAPRSTGNSEKKPDSPSLPYVSIRDFDISISVTVESTKLRLLELQLLHHFTSFTVKQDFLSSQDEIFLHMWEYAAPRLAFEHPFPANTIFPVTALQIEKTKSLSERKDMAYVHRTYVRLIPMLN